MIRHIGRLAESVPVHIIRLLCVGLLTTLVACSNGSGNDEESETPINSTPTGVVTISGTALEGETLTAANNLSDANGLGTISYQWQRDGVDISSATTNTYVLTSADVGALITVVASYTDGDGYAEQVASSATAQVGAVNFAPTGSVTITGTVAEKETLSVSHDLSDANGLGAISYQWQRDGADVSGATSSSYLLSYEDVDAVMSVTATYTDGAGNEETVASTPTVPVSRVNDMLVVFSDFDYYMFLNTSTDSGASWDGAMTFEGNGPIDAPYHYDGHGMADGKGNIIVAWGGEEMPGFGAEIDIAYKVSNDNGATWSAVSAINSEAATDTIDDEYPNIATNGQGRWITVWEGPNADGGTGDDILYAISDDNGVNWTAQSELAARVESTGDYYPSIANDGGDNWLVVWYSSDDIGGTVGTDTDILFSYSSDNGQTWSPRAALDSRAATDSASDTLASVAMDSNGNAIAVWVSNNDLGSTIGTDEDILVARSADAGQTWTTSAIANSNAATDNGGDRYPHAAMDNAGNAVVVWDSKGDLTGSEGTDQDVFVIRSSDYGASWSNPATLNSDATTDGTDADKEPKIVTDKDGNWLVVWRDGTNAIGSSISSDNGETWRSLLSVDEGIMSGNNYQAFPIVY